MTAAAAPTPPPLTMSPPLRELTVPWWVWLYEDVLGSCAAHMPDRPLRHAVWTAAAVPALARCGGLCYRWTLHDGISTLTLWTPDGSHTRSRHAATDASEPPFELLMRCWFDLCLDLDLISDTEHARVCGRLEAFDRRQREHDGNR